MTRATIASSHSLVPADGRNRPSMPTSGTIASRPPHYLAGLKPWAIGAAFAIVATASATLISAIVMADWAAPCGSRERDRSHALGVRHVGDKTRSLSPKRCRTPISFPLAPSHRMSIDFSVVQAIEVRGLLPPFYWWERSIGLPWRSPAPVIGQSWFRTV